MSEGEKADDPDGIGKLPMYLGPYEAWNFGKGLGYTLRMMRRYRKYISALAELKEALPPQARTAPPQNAWLPTLWENGSGLSFIPFVVAKPTQFIDATALSALLQQGFMVIAGQLLDLISGATLLPSTYHKILGGIAASRFRVAFSIPDNAMHEDLRPQPLDPEWRPDSTLRDRVGQKKMITVIAVIDDGLPFAHRNFRDADGRKTRVEFCWLQTVAIKENQKSVLFGREYTRKEIDGYIEEYGDDEDALYRHAGATADTEELGSLIDRHATHGAHVMDSATGYAAERHEVPPEEIRIIAVQLPNTIAWDTSGFGKDMYMLSAFHYIFDRADRIAKEYDVPNLRLVINFSYGFSGGRHDGEIELEAAINEMIQRRRTRKDEFFRPSPTALVLPSGNTFVDRLHGLIQATDFKDAAKLFWRIQPNDRTPSYLELWFWSGFDPRGYEIELFDPWGKLISTFPIGPDPSHRLQPGEDPGSMKPIAIGNEQIGQISADLHRAGGPEPQFEHQGRWRVLIVMAPTEPEDPTLPRAEPGKWTVLIKRARGPELTGPIHCWIQRSADPESLRSGSRQSYFCDSKNVRFTPEGDLAEEDSDNAFVRRFGSLNGLATGSSSLVVGGYRLGAGLGSSLACARPARYSSAGMDQSGKQVDCASMSDRTRALPGTIAAGVRSGSRSLVQGTSAAAPFVARQLVETFVTAQEHDVQQAADNNYLSLLRGYKPATGRTADATSGSDFDCHRDDPEFIKARLGTVLVRPHRQSGVEARACDQNGASEN